jgi:hypothetical protein
MKKLILAVMVLSLVFAASGAFAGTILHGSGAITGSGGGHASSFAVGGVATGQGTIFGHQAQLTINAGASGSRAGAGGEASAVIDTGDNDTSTDDQAAAAAVNGGSGAITGNAAAASTSQGGSSFQAQNDGWNRQVQVTSFNQTTAASAGVIPISVWGDVSTSTATSPHEIEH